ncbi:putative DNA endonuclease VII [Pseudomonas phage MPK7]|uniref:Putative DNA endonuclease VII n=1 Tax=Pseudomonas phage MPK7 TaxID=1225790 RepID=S4T002_9CAUD|nr:endonuclease VII [Pseudomonas phage MPK7]AFR52565.1 putative DNA endonuclease VII [Pseudomonas phage MPK7]
MTSEPKVYQIPRSQQRTFTLKLWAEQNKLCPLCGKPIDISVKGEAVMDHDHETGLVRGVLHRSCNTAEGKITNAAGSWGCKSMKYSDIIPYLRSLLTYLEGPKHPLIYPLHKTDEEKHEAKLAKRRQAAAKRKAAMAVAKHNARNV